MYATSGINSTLNVRQFEFQRSPISRSTRRGSGSNPAYNFRRGRELGTRSVYRKNDGHTSVSSIGEIWSRRKRFYSYTLYTLEIAKNSDVSIHNRCNGREMTMEISAENFRSNCNTRRRKCLTYKFVCVCVSRLTVNSAAIPLTN